GFFIRRIEDNVEQSPHMRLAEREARQCRLIEGVDSAECGENNQYTNKNMAVHAFDLTYDRLPRLSVLRWSISQMTLNLRAAFWIGSLGSFAVLGVWGLIPVSGQNAPSLPIIDKLEHEAYTEKLIDK